MDNTEQMRINRFIFLMLMIGFAWSCKKDNDPDVIVVPPRPLSEVALENDAEIIEYLQTHFYNYEAFENPPAGFDFRIKLDTIAGANADKTSIMAMPGLKSEIITVSSDAFGLDTVEEDVPHMLYYIEARVGVGVNPSIVDSLFLRYEGSRLDGGVFDSNVGAPIWLDLQGTLTQSNPGTIKGFKKGLPKFKAGGDIIVNDDGTFDVDGFGAGLLFLPSGLAYFRGSQPGAAYIPLIFNIELLVVNTADHDRDGVPSIVEDLNNNENLLDENTDNDGFPNYLDNDDDGDGIGTRDEIVIDAQGNITYPDTDGDGIVDYLDSDS